MTRDVPKKPATQIAGLRFPASRCHAAHHAVILAAGRGQRLGATVPKCLLSLGGRSLLERQLAALAAVGVTSATVVIGYRQDLVRAECARLQTKIGLDFRFIENIDYLDSNTAYSLYLARDVMSDAFFYLNADVLFDPALVADLQESPAANALLVEAKPCGAEEVKVIAPADRIMRIGKALPPEECLGEFLGVARFSREIGPAFAAELERLVEDEGRRRDFFEIGLDGIARSVELSAVLTLGRPVIEIDFPEDLARAGREVLPRIDAGTPSDGAQRSA